MTQQLHPWQNNEKFRSLDPGKQEMILQLTGHLQGHTITEALPALMEWKTQIDREASVSPQRRMSYLRSCSQRIYLLPVKSNMNLSNPFSNPV